MKNIITLFMIISLSLSVKAKSVAEEIVGDQFSLESTLEMFKKASSLEAFEAAINESANQVHNLDLNNDDQIDYLIVNDYEEGAVHAVTISAIVGADDIQDIAVIEIEQNGESSATLQIVGDADIFGSEVIIEPTDMEVRSSNSGPSMFEEVHRIVVNVWLWPSVRLIYSPRYVTYRSPWRWRAYPSIWRPWRPLKRSVFVSVRRPFVVSYRPVKVRRVTRASRIYKPHQRTSKVVVSRRTTVVKGNSGKVVKVNKKTTVKKGKRTSTKNKKVKRKVRKKSN